MTLQQLRFAITAASAGSMNRAAERLFVSQPTVTNVIRELETETGITLFNRTARGITLTPEGDEFLQYARRVLQQYELLESRYGDGHDIKRKFAVSSQHYSFVDKAFVETVKHFGARNFEFALRETRTRDVIRDVSELKSELGVLFRSEYNRRVLDKLLRDNGLKFTTLIQCCAYVYLWRGHPLAKEKAITFSQLADYPCLSFEQGTESSSFLSEEILMENDYPQIIYTSDRATNLNLMVGLNAFTLCSGIICEELNGEDYVAIPYAEDSENRNSIMEIGYIHKRNTIPSETGRVFLEEMKKYLATCQQTALPK